MLRNKMMRMKYIALGLVLILVLSGCSAEVSNVGHAMEKKQEDVEEDKDSYSLVGAYDSADKAVIGDIDEESKQITLMNLQSGRNYILHYAGTSYISDKYGSAMTAGQLKQGQIVDVTFLKSNRQINSLQVAADAWKYDQVEKYNLEGPNSTATIGSAVYALGADAQVFSNGHQSDLMDIVKGDVLTISGVGHDIYSINIDRGHGYVRLKNDHALVGGWIEIGNKVITRVSAENMLLAVPEGSYTVKMYNDVSTVNQEIIVERNQEVVLDCSGIKANESKTGYVKFNVTPVNAQILVDDKAVEAATPVQLSYGIHPIEVSAPGYQTMSKYISVGAGFAEISITLEETPEDLEEKDPSEYEEEIDPNGNKNPFDSDPIGLPETVSKNDKDKTVSKNEPIGTETTNKVYIDAPEDAEVFVDGVYVGLVPTCFKKVTGSHTLTLRKVGYQTRSYSLYLYDDGKDITYSFSNLEPEEDTSKKDDKKDKDKDKKDDTSSDEDNKTPSEDETDNDGDKQDEETPTGDDNVPEPDKPDADVPSSGQPEDGKNEENTANSDETKEDTNSKTDSTEEKDENTE